jgi:hypothetical protein
MTSTVDNHFSVISICDETFTKENAAGCHLAIEMGYDSLSFAAVDTKRNKYVFLQSYTLKKVLGFETLISELKHLVETSEFLRYGYKSIGVGFITSKFTLVPAPLFDESNKDIYLNFNHPIDKVEEVILHDVLKNTDSVLLFAIPKKVLSTIETLFKKAIVKHQSSSLIDLLVLQHKNASDKKVIVHIQASHFELIVTQGKKLLFFNSFKYQSTEDFIYYVLFVYEQLNMNPEEQELVLSGEIEKNSAIYSILHKYIRTVSFIRRPEQIEYSYGFNSVANHFYYNVLSQYLCV